MPVHKTKTRTPVNMIATASGDLSYAGDINCARVSLVPSLYLLDFMYERLNLSGRGDIR